MWVHRFDVDRFSPFSASRRGCRSRSGFRVQMPVPAAVSKGLQELP
jgi:hypothetical protein